MFSSKKAIASLTSFTLLLFIFLLVLVFSVYLSNLSKNNAIDQKAKVEIINSINSLRSELVVLATYPSSNLTYSSILDPESISIDLYNSRLVGKYGAISVNVSSLGLNFCSQYTFYPSYGGTFIFNGTCISLV